MKNAEFWNKLIEFATDASFRFCFEVNLPVAHDPLQEKVHLGNGLLQVRG